MQWVNRKMSGLIIVLLVLSATVAIHPPAFAAPNYSGIIADEAYWISTAQIPTVQGRSSSGAIAVHKDPSNGKWLIRPYDANIAARGMLASGPHYYPMVKAWMQWYLNHLNWPDYNNLHGTVYDYNVDAATYTESLAQNPGTAISPFYDSTDSYAATFLTLAKQYSLTTGDNAFLQQYQYQLNAIGDVIQSTEDTDSLTWAKPDYHAKYLMDNTEVYQGISARAWLDQYVLNDPSGATYYTAQANQVKSAVQNFLWQTSLSMYASAKNSAGGYDTPSWSVWDPTSTAQVYPLQTGTLSYTDNRATTLWAAFNSHWPNWTTTHNNPDSRPWMTICYASAVMHDKIRADACLSNAVSNWTATNRPWPWTVLESGMMALAAQQTSGL